MCNNSIKHRWRAFAARLAVAAVLSISAAATADESFSDALTKALKDDSISDSLIESTVKILTDEGFTNVELLQNVDITVLKGMGIKTGPASSVCKHFGQCKEPVKPLPPPANMTTSQLLARLAEQPSDTDALGFLKETRDVKQAEPKTQGRWAVVTGSGSSKKLDPQATLAYLSYINRGGANLSSYKGGRVTTIDIALGHGNDVWQHPLYANQTITDGLDSAEVDWSDVPADITSENGVREH